MDERQWLAEHFKGRVGRFLEIGVFDAERSSLTHGLIDAGWNGVLVEASPTRFNCLLEQYANDPRVLLAHAAVSDRSGLAEFWDDGGGEESTLSYGHMARHAEATGRPYTAYRIATIGAVELLSELGGPANWQLVIIDTEGTSTTILQALPLAAMLDTEVICFEQDADGLEAAIACVREPYRVAQVLPPNVIAVRNR